MSLIPAYVEDEYTDELTEEIETPREFGIDFTTGQLTGKIVEGVEAIKVWCYLALRCARYRFFILSWQYGSEIEELYGQGFSAEHIECEAKEMIKECLLENEFIENVEVTNVSYTGSKLSARIEITTIYDDTYTDDYYYEEAA